MRYQLPELGEDVLDTTAYRILLTWLDGELRRREQADALQVDLRPGSRPSPISATIPWPIGALLEPKPTPNPGFSQTGDKTTHGNGAPSSRWRAGGPVIRPKSTRLKRD
jgi:hypothetical protein